MLPIITLALLSFAGAGFASGRGLNQIVNTADDVLVEDANLWMPDASKDNDDSNLRLLITFQTSPEDKTGEVDPMTISALAEISSLANVKNVKKISPRAGIHLVILSNAREAKQTMRELKKNEHVKSVEQDHLVYASDINPDDPYFRNGDLWGIEKINAPLRLGCGHRQQRRRRLRHRHRSRLQSPGSR